MAVAGIQGQALAAAVGELDELVGADGAHFELDDWDAAIATVRLRLVLDDDSCADCVVPRGLLETMALERLRRSEPAVARLELEDPREQP